MEALPQRADIREKDISGSTQHIYSPHIPGMGTFSYMAASLPCEQVAPTCLQVLNFVEQWTPIIMWLGVHQNHRRKGVPNKNNVISETVPQSLTTTSNTTSLPCDHTSLGWYSVLTSHQRKWTLMPKMQSLGASRPPSCQERHTKEPSGT